MLYWKFGVVLPSFQGRDCGRGPYTGCEILKFLLIFPRALKPVHRVPPTQTRPARRAQSAQNRHATSSTRPGGATLAPGENGLRGGVPGARVPAGASAHHGILPGEVKGARRARGSRAKGVSVSWRVAHRRARPAPGSWGGISGARAPAGVNSGPYVPIRTCARHAIMTGAGAGEDWGWGRSRGRWWAA